MGLQYYVDINYAPVTDLLRQSIIKNENHLMDFSASNSQYCPDTVRSTGAYMIFYQGGPIYHGTYVPGPVAQSSSESEYNTACTAGIDLAHFRVLMDEFFEQGYRYSSRGSSSDCLG